MRYIPESAGVIALIKAGTVVPNAPKVLKLLDYLTLHREQKYTQAELRRYVDVCIRTCSIGLNELIALNLVTEVKSKSSARGWVKAYTTNVHKDGSLISEGSLNAKLDA